MRSVHFREQSWFFSKKGNFQGLRTGNDCCTEHEVGIKGLQKALGLHLAVDGLERFRVNTVPENLVMVDNERFVSIVYRDWYPLSAEQTVKDYERYSFDDQPVVAWEEDSFLIMAPKGQKKYVKAVEALWKALQDGDVILGGEYSQKFAGTGIGFYIASKMPKEELEAADRAMIEKSEARRRLIQATENEGFEEVVSQLREAKRDWFYLGPKHIREDGKVAYWLNPQDQQNNLFGMVTIDDLKHWVKGKGRIPANMPE